jgi:hypothetical protein
MTRDKEFIRKLLFAIETHECSAKLQNPPIEGYDEPTIDHHVFLMWEAGFVDARSDRIWFQLGGLRDAKLRITPGAPARRLLRWQP